MSNCPAVDIANQLRDDWNAASADGDFSLEFTARTTMGHGARNLDVSHFASPKVDIVPPMTPDLEVVSRGDFKYGHQLGFMIGLRQALTSSYMTDELVFDLTEMAPLLNTFYELIKWLYPSGENPRGDRVTVAPWVATSVPPAQIACLWDPKMLAKKLYCGVFIATLQVIEQSVQAD